MWIAIFIPQNIFYDFQTINLVMEPLKYSCKKNHFTFIALLQALLEISNDTLMFQQKRLKKNKKRRPSAVSENQKLVEKNIQTLNSI
jgi:hypothetical protein